MTKQSIKAVSVKTLQVVKVSAISIVVVFALVGLYVVSSADLRNQVIDHAQGQSEAPKAN